MSKLQYSVNMTPEMVYSEGVRPWVRQTLRTNGLIVTAFRPTVPGDLFITTTNANVVTHMSGVSYPSEPRLIVKKRDPAPPVVGEVRVTVKDVYDVELADLLEIADRLGVEIIGFRVPNPGEMWLRRDPEDHRIPEDIQVSRECYGLGSCGLYEEIRARSHAGGIRAIVREKQVEVDPFA